MKMPKKEELEKLPRGEANALVQRYCMSVALSISGGMKPKDRAAALGRMHKARELLEAL